MSLSIAILNADRALRSAFRRLMIHLSVLLFIGLLAGCVQREQAVQLLVTLVADGRERTLQQPVAITVGEFLAQNEIEIVPPDEVSPPIFTQLADGMRVVVVRVREENDCDEVELPYRTQRIPNEALAPGDERLAQTGQPGTEQVCYRVAIRDGVRQPPVEISRVTVREAQPEVIYVGPSGEIEAVSITGTLAYLSNGNVWLMRGSSTDKRQLTSSNDSDGKVFDLSPDGLRLLFSRQTVDEVGVFNRLWMITDTARGVSPTALLPQNVLYASWIPGQLNTISYATAEATAVTPGWDANNDLWLMEIDPQTGDPINARELVEASLGGLDGWWGTDYQWSPDGRSLAYMRADSVGLVDLNSGELTSLVQYALFETRQPWSWRTTVSWSPDEEFFATTVHGDPIGSEPRETSPAFHVAIVESDGAFAAEIARNTGIWSHPEFSPITNGTEDENAGVAYLHARDLSNNVSPNAEYDLVVADRDGSNARTIFPAPDEPGLNADAALTWSPDGRQLAFVYLGNLWMIDVQSQIAYQLTLDGGASHPLWTR